MAKRLAPPSASSDSDSDNGDAQFSDDGEAAGAAQWIDEDDLEELADSEEDEFAQEREEAVSVDQDSMKKDLSSLSFGALKNARHLLNEQEHSAHSASDSDSASEGSDDEDDDDSGSVASSSSSTSQHRSNPHKRVKRADKHAPMEVSSKRPVSRKRAVVDVPKIERRDPRFSSLSGSFDERTFSKSYGFITKMQQTEASDLKASLIRARKLLTHNSPANVREERAAEVNRLERVLKRAESNVQSAKRKNRELDALSTAKRAEREKRAAGKGEWHMKKSAKNQLLAEARFNELAQEGKGAVRKAIAKRQLKISQKEKRSRPGPRPSGSSGARPSGGGGGGSGSRGPGSGPHRDKRQRTA